MERFLHFYIAIQTTRCDEVCFVQEAASKHRFQVLKFAFEHILRNIVQTDTLMSFNADLAL